MTAYLAVAYEYAVEMTYPLPEGTAAGLLNLSATVSRNQLYHHHIFLKWMTLQLKTLILYCWEHLASFPVLPATKGAWE